MRARLCFRTVTLFASIAATACGGTQEPSESALPSGPEIVSEAIAQPQGRGSSAFVSMPPGGLTTGVKATIRNAATGDLKTVDIVNGGWDPVAIAARAGDSLRMTIMAGNLGSREYMHVVPRGRNPMILRTEPVAGNNDVGIFSRIVVVFSEPINPASVTPARVHLRRRGLPVAADVRFSENGLEMEVLPQERLAPFSTYALIVSPDLADQAGDRLERGAQVQFTTSDVRPYIVPGEYELSALITHFDPGWGYDLTDYRYTAALSIEESTPFRGSLRDWWLVGPGGDSTSIATTGVIKENEYPLPGTYVLDLIRPEGEKGSSFHLSLVVEKIGPGSIEGHWGCCGHISGTYTAKRK